MLYLVTKYFAILYIVLIFVGDNGGNKAFLFGFGLGFATAFDSPVVITGVWVGATGKLLGLIVLVSEVLLLEVLFLEIIKINLILEH